METNCINRLTEIIQWILNDDCNFRQDGSFKYIPYKYEKFIELLKDKKGKFLDVGCGIGDKVMIAKELGFDAHGIEKDKKLFKIADKYLFNIKNIDAFGFDDYDKFDVIYMYKPYEDEKKLKQLRDLINSKKKETATFIEV